MLWVSISRKDHHAINIDKTNLNTSGEKRPSRKERQDQPKHLRIPRSLQWANRMPSENVEKGSGKHQGVKVKFDVAITHHHSRTPPQKPSVIIFSRRPFNLTRMNRRPYDRPQGRTHVARNSCWRMGGTWSVPRKYCICKALGPESYIRTWQSTSTT
jgi:hypothetical protein